MIAGKEHKPEYLLLLCRMASFGGCVIALGWLLVFILTRNWPLVLSLAGLALATLPCWILSRRGHFTTGLQCAQLVCMIFIIVFCILFDVPNHQVNRTTHLYLPVVAMVGYINYRRKPSRIQACLLTGNLLAFAVFCSTRMSFPFAHPMPDAFREISSWVNGGMVTLMLSGGMMLMHADFSRRAAIVKQLQDALSRNEFELHYQAQVSVSGEITGAEALVRWRHPAEGILAPARFLPDAQQAGFMPQIGRWVLREACMTLARWQRRPETENLTLAINITADHMCQPDIVGQIEGIVRDAGVSPSLLKIELTESVFATDMPVVVESMQRLADAGFRFALDDFGTGFSSLSYLRQLPLEQLKIDRSFIQAASVGEKGKVIARNIVRMGRELQLQVLAEGIEDPQQWKMMRAFGCEAFQGYYFSRPLRGADFEALMLQSTIRTGCQEGNVC